MKKQYFGTDGVRGRTNTPPMTAETAMHLSMAAGVCFRTGKPHCHSVVIGKDTRLSGYMIEPALTAGFTSVGMDVILLGPLPTPGVAMMTRSLRADLGVMISASHNGFQDNGLKFFGPDGYKLSDDMEQAIEAQMMTPAGDILVAPEALGRARRIDDSQARYIEIVKGSFPRGIRLSGMRICIDCAHGTGYKVAPAALYELGAEVFPVGVAPNGCNINHEVGSTSPHALQKAVQTYRADIGIALDGDGDRCVIVDEKGNVVDGDQLLGLVALNWLEDGRLQGKGIVTTIMSNMGLETCLNSRGLNLKRTRVGDRYVTEAMRQAGFNLGGEPSGHIVMSDYSTTGDGLMAALQVLAIMVKRREPLSQIARIFDPVPQKHTNVAYTASDDPLAAPHVRKVIAAAEKSLSENGRLVIRKSGTEPLVRIMVESGDDRLCNKVVSDVAEALRAHVSCTQQMDGVHEQAGDTGVEEVA